MRKLYSKSFKTFNEEVNKTLYSKIQALTLSEIEFKEGRIDNINDQRITNLIDNFLNTCIPTLLPTITLDKDHLLLQAEKESISLKFFFEGDGRFFEISNSNNDHFINPNHGLNDDIVGHISSNYIMIEMYRNNFICIDDTVIKSITSEIEFRLERISRRLKDEYSNNKKDVLYSKLKRMIWDIKEDLEGKVLQIENNKKIIAGL